VASGGHDKIDLPPKFGEKKRFYYSMVWHFIYLDSAKDLALDTWRVVDKVNN